MYRILTLFNVLNYKQKQGGNVMKIKSSNKSPEGSIIASQFLGEIDYVDSFQVIVPDKNESVDYITTCIFSALPDWGEMLMALRNTIVKPFGLEVSSERPERLNDPNVQYEIGDKAVLFPVVDRNDSEIVMGKDDTHLDFKCSVLAEKTENERCTVSLTTIVSFHNRFGRLYFSLIKPFHKLLIKQCLKGYLKRA